MFQFIKNEFEYIKAQTGWMAFLIATSVIFTILGPLPFIPWFHFPFLAMAAIYCVYKRGRWEISMLLLLIYIPIAILIDAPDVVFRSWQRFLLFVLVALFASPLIQNEYAIKLRKQVMFVYLGYCTVIAIGSFACYFLGVNYMRNQSDGSVINYIGSAGGFGGLTRQSMVLGPISGMATLYMFYRYFQSEQENKKWYIIAMLSCFVTVFLSSSRSALAATMVGSILILYQSKQNFGRFVKTLLGFGIIVALILSIWGGATAGLAQKQAANEKLGQYGSRTAKWEARMAEFGSNPLTGVGFCAQDPNGNDYYNRITGTVEPGSSWLAILSMTGLIGFILFCNIIRKPLMLFSRERTYDDILGFSLLIFFCVHMIAEGYIFAGGSIFCFFTWLIIGCAYDAYIWSQKKLGEALNTNIDSDL